MSVLKDLRRPVQPGQETALGEIILEQTGTQLTVISAWWWVVVGKCLCFSWNLLTTILLQLRLELHGVSNP